MLLGATACSNAPGGGGSAQDAYRRGAAALAQGDPRTARIELMNAIKAEPDNPRFRLLQARIYILLGDGVAAEAEIRTALADGLAPAEAHHLLAHAFILQGQPDRALEEASRASPNHAAYAARMRGRAQQALGNLDGAARAFDEAAAAAPDDSATWIDAARFRRDIGELGGAITAADRALALEPRSVEALTFRGELTRGQYGLRAALAWFDRALEIDPDNVPALLERAATLGDLGEAGAMLADSRKALVHSPKNPVAYYLQAMLAARAGKFALARSLYLRTRGAFDDKPAGMLLASAIALETGNAEQAVRLLQRLVAIQPDNAKARRLLAASQWRLGDAAGTIETLRPLADRRDADAYVLTLAGQAHAKRGNVNEASAYFARAALPERRAATALLAGGADRERLDVLRRAANARPGEASAQIQLIRALLGGGLAAEALDRARRLQAAHPGAPETHLLVGDAFGLLGDFARAAGEYRKAANLAFTEPVAMRLIEALRRSGDNKGASKVLELFLDQNPRSVPAQMLAAGSFLRAGRWDDAIGIYEDLRLRLGDRDASVLSNLAWAYSGKGDRRRAIALARRAWQLDRNNPSTADTLGWLLFRTGEDRAAGLLLLQRAARGAPSNAEIRRRLSAARAS
jgi:tetratricopeptide (TPR) repeat protein